VNGTPEGYEPDELARDLNVSRETLSRLKLYVSLLNEWNSRQNLVSAASLGSVWRRHILDSGQLLRLVPAGAETLVDLGAGAGFPGLVLAILSEGRLKVTLVEATLKKCRFLEEIAQRSATDVKIEHARIEHLPRKPFDVVTARACAPLDRLLAYAQGFLGPDSVCLFLKGQNVGAELTAAHNLWRMQVREHQSLSDPLGRILEIKLP